MFVFGVTLLASTVALTLAVAWATTGASAQRAGSCPAVEIPVPYDGRGSLSPDDCRDPYDREDYADIYSFRLDAESNVTIDLDSDSFHAFVRLLNHNRDQIEKDETRRVGENVRISRTLSAGMYEIVATEYTVGRWTGAYDLRITASRRFSGSVDRPCSRPKPDNQWLGGLPGYPQSPDSDAVHRVKKLIARVLFQIPRNLDVLHCVNADYNDFGEAGPYVKGHAGWDVQTTNVGGGDATANVPFYSLTEGRVDHIDDELGAIGVDDGKNTVYYLHARHIYVYKDQQVAVGERLGIQGNAGLGFSNPSTQEHVHIEVHRNQERPHNFRGAVNAPGRGGTDSLLLWHEQLNYLCAESLDRWRQLVSSGQCEPLDEIKAPSPHP